MMSPHNHTHHSTQQTTRPGAFCRAPKVAVTPQSEHAAPKSVLHRGQQLSATTARNVLAVTEWRLSARSAGSDDVLDDSQPSDRADQAATSRDGMSQLCMSLEGPPSWHVHRGNAHRLDTTCKCESPTTSLDICLASSRPLHTPPPPLPLPRTPCTHTQTAAHENDL